MTSMMKFCRPPVRGAQTTGIDRYSPVTPPLRSDAAKAAETYTSLLLAHTATALTLCLLALRRLLNLAVRVHLGLARLHVAFLVATLRVLLVVVVRVRLVSPRRCWPLALRCARLLLWLLLGASPLGARRARCRPARRPADGVLVGAHAELALWPAGGARA
ncbi:hypothetical protein FA09DRAFT_104918 [Tilletiopsis washingtonensis]|uniref:Uncharacterized protein n=1 Tax=Tilletiopsis washingtonensis TaxID=58919 RepID=A0A316Z534_9BASI|nr:hypothetical protein FA09DRAFT_104918 [Tilletiopsis washingtonensis]PWN96052.1 hypothetical protein FA09DRAFT_104918 [Tilletiopsis washingtonensis]